MASCEILDVNIVPNAGAVLGVVVVAKDIDDRSASDSDLCNIWHEVVGSAVRVFTDPARLVCADGVKISEQDDVPLSWLALTRVPQDLLDVQLGPTVRVHSSCGGILLERSIRGGESIDSR